VSRPSSKRTKREEGSGEGGGGEGSGGA